MAKTQSNRNSAESGSGSMSNKTRSVLKKIQEISRKNHKVIAFTAKDRLKPNAKTFGSTRQVATGFAKKTEGGLMQRDIIAFQRHGKRTFVTRGAHERSKKTFGNMKNKMGLRMPYFKYQGKSFDPEMSYREFINASDNNSTKQKIISHYLK